jgi:hypothetical protein
MMRKIFRISTPDGCGDRLFFGIPARNRVVGVWGTLMQRFKDRKVMLTRLLLDTLSLMPQLGVVPVAPELDANPRRWRSWRKLPCH